MKNPKDPLLEEARASLRRLRPLKRKLGVVEADGSITPVVEGARRKPRKTDPKEN